MVNYIRLKQIKTSIKETGNTLIEKTSELTDLVNMQEDQMGAKTNELKESFSTQSKLLEQKLEELGSLLNFVTMNLAADPLKEFGIHLQPPVGAHSFAGDQSVTVHQSSDNIRDMIHIVTARIDSLIEVMNSNQQRMLGDFKTLQVNLDRLDSSVHQNKERTIEELSKLSKTVKNQSVSASDFKEPLPDSYLENGQWWAKASTLTSALCTALTAVVLVYELLK